MVIDQKRSACLDSLRADNARNAKPWKTLFLPLWKQGLNMKINQARKKLLSDFISNPCRETLTFFVSSMDHDTRLNVCLLEYFTDGRRHPLTENLGSDCDKTCFKLRKMRHERCGFYSCFAPFVMKAYDVRPAETLLSFIEFKAYLDYLDDIKGGKDNALFRNKT